MIIPTREEFFNHIYDKFNGHCPICNRKLNKLSSGSICYTDQSNFFDYRQLENSNFQVSIANWRWNYIKKETEYMGVYTDAGVTVMFLSIYNHLNVKEHSINMKLPFDGNIYKYVISSDQLFDKIDKLMILK